MEHRDHAVVVRLFLGDVLERLGIDHARAEFDGGQPELLADDLQEFQRLDEAHVDEGLAEHGAAVLGAFERGLELLLGDFAGAGEQLTEPEFTFDFRHSAGPRWYRNRQG